MPSAQVDVKFWNGKNVFLTGHTGFKGSWLSLWLASMGANVTGFALAPNSTPNLYSVLEIDSLIGKSYISDIREISALKKAMSDSRPDIVIHMAAQPLVRYSYANPVETYATNVMGTVHVLECMRSIDSVRASVVVTTDKCYENKEWLWGYRENDPMGGYDPYSNSKGCAELVTSAYRQSYFSSLNSINSIASARSGNVVGGGDWSKDRLIPDAIKAFELGEPLMIRNPSAIRPWQHVLEPLSGYLILAQALYDKGSTFASGWNFGPLDEDIYTAQEVIEILISNWGSTAYWKKGGAEQQLHETQILKLDCSKSRVQLGWVPKWNLETAIQKIIQWHKLYLENEAMQKVSLAQIHEYMGLK